MPLSISAPILVRYRNEHGQEVDDVGFWIVPRLSWRDLRGYIDMANTVDPTNPGDIQRVAEFLVDRGFVRFEGVLDENDQLLPKERWEEAPGDLLIQMTRELQRRNTPSAVTHPNSSTPSAQSSEAESRAPLSPPTSEPSSTTPTSSPTE